jgi:hypothetical protein
MEEQMINNNLDFINFLRNMTLLNTNPIIIKYEMLYCEIEFIFDVTLVAIGESGYSVDIICRFDDDENIFAELVKINVVFTKKVIAHLPKYCGYNGNPHMLWTMRTSFEMEGSVVKVLEAVWVILKKLSKIHYDVWNAAVNSETDSNEAVDYSR